MSKPTYPVKKIFIVDDDESIHDIINLIFEQDLVHGVVKADNLEKSILTFSPDIILMDIRMGDADGRELCNRLKENPNIAHIPILLLSALNIDLNNLGCIPDDVIEKPFDIGHLVEKVNHLLGRKI
ncbi:PleD family two-component system response regulator [Pedobacter jeongneungensis]|uniref:response regulator n=1 Tax=Pedobacter jeongneungensis TaxID=947309 RepID=UPI000468E8CF|nr:response regulator [Pedobacter jeongneungensis]